MSDFIDVCKKFERMCDLCQCDECPLPETQKTTGLCADFVLEHADVAEKLINKWSDEHPVITRKNKLKELFPEADIDVNSCRYVKCSNENLSCETCKFAHYWEEEFK